MVDYSKWKDIEISDDEDETHPNIDTPSLFRWRHQARVERMEERKREQEEYERKKQAHIAKLKEAKEKLAAQASDKKPGEMDELKKALQELEREGEEIRKKDEELKKKEKTTPWNVDTISEPGFTKTVINKKPPRPKDEDLTEEERDERMKKFVKENEQLVKKFGMLRRYDDSRQFLTEHSQLACEDTANYLVIWCINLEMQEKHELMAHVAHQTICMQYILELSRQLDVDPRACISTFFSKIQLAEKMYMESFDDELKQFKSRIEKRAAEKVAEALREAEEEEKQKRLGPGGLDPVDVYEELPDALKKCFDAMDVPMLQETIANMPEKDAVYYMNRCVASGLWVPGKNDEEPTMKEKHPETEPATTSTDDVD